MSSIDALIADVLREMGVKPNEPARWLGDTHKCIDLSTGKPYRTMNNGYICSKCGKHSWSKKSICDGCNSQMPNC